MTDDSSGLRMTFTVDSFPLRAAQDKWRYDPALIELASRTDVQEFMNAFAPIFADAVRQHLSESPSVLQPLLDDPTAMHQALAVCVLTLHPRLRAHEAAAPVDARELTARWSHHERDPDPANVASACEAFMAEVHQRGASPDSFVTLLRAALMADRADLAYQLLDHLPEGHEQDVLAEVIDRSLWYIHARDRPAAREQMLRWGIEACKRFFGSPDVWWLTGKLGNLLMGQGRTDEAIDLLKSAWLAGSDNRQTADMLSLDLTRQKRWAEALTLLEQARDRLPAERFEGRLDKRRSRCLVELQR